MPQTIRLSPPSCMPTLTTSAAPQGSDQQRRRRGSRGRACSSTGLLVQDRDASQLGECALLLIEAHPLVSERHHDRPWHCVAGGWVPARNSYSVDAGDHLGRGGGHFGAAWICRASGDGPTALLVMLGDSAVSVGNFALVDTASAACVSRAERHGQRRLPTHGG